MTDIEVTVCLLLLAMGVPDFCRWARRPALGYPIFVLFGLFLGPLMGPGARSILLEAGEVGFLLLLFEVGLEINLPRARQLWPPLRDSLVWMAVQYPVILGLGIVAGLKPPTALLAAAALVACSVGMAHPGWKTFPGLSEDHRAFVLRMMVLLEVTAIVVMAVESVALDEGFGWQVWVKLAGILVMVYLISRFARRLTQAFQLVLEKATHWRIHFMVLLLLVVCAIGERLGLSGAKTAFFLGLFMSRATHDGKGIEDYIAPLSRGFLIPIFFLSLGAQIELELLASVSALHALGGALLILGLRQFCYTRWLRRGGDGRAYLLLCPNLTMVALAATLLIRHEAAPEATAWLVMTGLFVTVLSIAWLPIGAKTNAEAAGGE